jgi:hypothetical protein
MSPKVPGEVSVFRIDNLSEAEIWNIGDAIRSDKKAKARGDMLVASIIAIKNEENENLMVIEDKKQYALHANITNLPSLDKAKEKVVAIEIAKQTKLAIKP